ncbi:MAG: D-glycero-beta-D-manno-heptose 1-phosphate adenylyltransferase [Bacteroidota bacterium]
MGKVISLKALLPIRRTLARKGVTVVFTNGTFDILHRGHVEYLAAARKLGDILVVGLNTDRSIRRIKGKNRPINPNGDRAAVLTALSAVDYVVFFGDDTPARLITRLVPDVLVKGADWKPQAIVGADTVLAHGGRVRTIRLTRGRSTSNVINRVLRRYRTRKAS